MANLLKQLQSQEDAIHIQLEEIKTQLCDAVAAQAAPGIRQINSHICIASMASLDRTILAPEYYLANCQATAVRKALANKRTLADTTSAVRSLLMLKNAGDIRLNPQTLEIIEKSEIGQYAMV